MRGWDYFDDPNFGPILLGLAAALIAALLVFTSLGEGSMPEPLTTIPPPDYVHPEEAP